MALLRRVAIVGLVVLLSMQCWQLWRALPAMALQVRRPKATTAELVIVPSVPEASPPLPSLLPSSSLSRRRRQFAAPADGASSSFMTPPSISITPKTRPRLSGGGSSTQCELLFGIPTLARPGGVNYLNLTLEALLCQMDAAAARRPRQLSTGGPDASPCIAVYEVRSPSQISGKSPFELARQQLAGRADVMFVRSSSCDNSGSSGIGSAITEGHVTHDSARSERTRQQTRDVASALLTLAPWAQQYFVLLEDDWVLCEGALDAIQYLLRKSAIYQPRWAALRFSYGLNGIALHAADIAPLATFLLHPEGEKENTMPDAPVDHLTYRWLRGKYQGGRRYHGERHMMAFRHTLFWHIGEASAVGNRQGRHRPKCYALTKEWLFDKESFHEDECPDDDIWPCHGRPDASSDQGLLVRNAAQHAVANALGARDCGAWRVCWGRAQRASGRPDGELAKSKCVAQLSCANSSGRASPSHGTAAAALLLASNGQRSLPNHAGGEPSSSRSSQLQRPCIVHPPEYAMAG